MSEAEEPSTPLEAYKAIIDHFVERSSSSVSARNIELGSVPWIGAGPGEPEAKAVAEWTASLSEDQRRLLARLLRLERTESFHDALVSLEWWIACREVALTFRGEPMPVNFAEGMHCDFFGRLTGWEWPKE
ncbi:MAG: hypothetical protein QM783_14805 [Phycisphaerales bacterium]